MGAFELWNSQHIGIAAQCEAVQQLDTVGTIITPNKSGHPNPVML